MHNYIQIVSYGITGMLMMSLMFAITLAVKNYERRFHLYFAAVVLTVIIYNTANTLAVAAEVLTVSDYIVIEKITNISLFLCAIVYVRLISHMSGYESKILFSMLNISVVVFLYFNHIRPYGIVIEEITSIGKTVTPWGETVNSILFKTSSFIHAVNLFIAGLIYLAFRASVVALKNHRREEGFLIVGSLMPPLTILIGVSILIDQRLISPFLGYFAAGLGFLSLTLVLGHKSVKEVLNSVDRRKKLKENEDKYRLLFDTAGDAIILMLHGKIVDCNQVTLNIFRCAKEDVIGKTVTAMSPDLQPDGASSGEKAKRIFRTPSHEDHQFVNWTYQRIDGSCFNAEIRLNTFVLNEENYVQAIVRDVTRKLEAENILRQSEGKYRELSEYLEEAVNARTFELVETNKQLEAFSNSVSHDLRTPLRAIDTFSKIILEEEFARVSDDGKRRLEVIRKNTAKMSVLIDDLLAFARTGNIELKKVSVDVNILITEILEELLPETGRDTIDITMETLPKFMGDPSLLRQVFVNLISNALKFTRTCETPKISITGSETPGEASVTIEDNGCGFDMKFSDKLFGVFSGSIPIRSMKGPA